MTSSTDKFNNSHKNESSQEEILERKKNSPKKGNKCIRNRTPMKTKVRRMTRKALEKK
jgi:hypothetical protein